MFKLMALDSETLVYTLVYTLNARMLSIFFNVSEVTWS